MGEAERLSKGEGAGEAMRLAAALAGSKTVSSPSSRPEIRRRVRGLRVEALELVELARTLLALIADTWPGEVFGGRHPAHSYSTPWDRSFRWACCVNEGVRM